MKESGYTFAPRDAIRTAWKGAVLLLLAETAFAASTTLAKCATRSGGIPGTEVSAFRFAMGLLLVGTYVAVRRVSIRPLAPRYVLLRAVFNTAAVLLFFTGVQFTTVTNANMLNMTYPAFVVLLGPRINRERSRGAHYAGVALALLGAYTVIRPRFAGVNAGDLAALASSLVAAFAIAFLRESRKHDSGAVVLFFLMAIGTPVTLAVALPTWVAPRGLTLVQVLLSAAVAVLGQVLITAAYRFIGAASGALVATSRIPIAALLGWMVFGDEMTRRTLLGGCLILAALVTIALASRRSPG